MEAFFAKQLSEHGAAIEVLFMFLVWFFFRTVYGWYTSNKKKNEDIVKDLDTAEKELAAQASKLEKELNKRIDDDKALNAERFQSLEKSISKEFQMHMKALQETISALGKVVDQTRTDVMKIHTDLQIAFLKGDNREKEVQELKAETKHLDQIVRKLENVIELRPPREAKQPQ